MSDVELTVEAEAVNGAELPISNGEGCHNDDESTEHAGVEERGGTISSARFNLLSTMVGGGSLSLPMAFHKSGNAFLGPLLIILVAASADFCFRILVASTRLISATQPIDTTKKGKDSFESIACAAFGPKARVFSIGLVFAMCFVGTVGYAVLLRDMLEPIADAIVTPTMGSSGVSLSRNLTMLSVILLVTPLCTLETLTSLRRFGAASMTSVLILGGCVVYRSLQCNFSLEHDSDRHTSWFAYMSYFPQSIKELLDAVPLFVSCFVCHYNVLPVHNELSNPTPPRVSWWIRSTVWFAASFYLTIGYAGSMYGNCTPSGTVQGNVLLDFDEHDPLLLIGRLCLALTITLAFPMLVIPARDIVLRIVQGNHDSMEDGLAQVDGDVQNELRAPLLVDQDDNPMLNLSLQDLPTPFRRRLVTAICVFWSGAAVACCVSSIDVVWGLLGSSLSILLSYLIPCGSYIALVQKADRDGMAESSPTTDGGWKKRLMSITAHFLVIIFTPLMFISTANAIYNTFLKNNRG